MFLSKVMDHLESEVDDIFGGVSLKDKILKYYEYSSLTKGHSEIDNTDDIWPLTVFLTPPSSPDSSPSYEAILNEKQDETDAEMLTGASRTKDLKSMLIRDCMWNGESPKKGRNFEKLRPLTKTPPLIDCNLRIMYVDPSEIWPFNFNEQLKAGKATAVDNNNDNTDEEVEVDVVGLEGSQKVESKNKDQTESKNETQKCEVAPASFNVVETTSQHCKNTDHDYSCNLRSGTKRRRSSNSDSDKENCTEEKTRILSGDESDPDCEVIGRATHNVLERKRRNELKLRFQYLRDSIPDLRGNDRAPKVSILQKAYNYILQVQAEERCLLEEIRIQKNRKEQLLKKVLEMQKNNFSCQDI